ncbi:MAG: response regulator [Polyangiaceae bacterium]|nr:response regulator [Polyangiaceae bacterium]
MTHTVLIVDDSLTVRMDLAEAFEVAGFRPLLCGTVADARALVRREWISIAILDVLLPDGDGVELLQELKTNTKTAEAPVLMLSSEADVKDRIRGLQTGADDYVGKPYDTGSVVARARELVHARLPPSLERDAVLVVDDSPTFRDELRRALEGAGYVVFTAASGEEGLRAAATHRPTALLVDGVMPGIDGATVIRKIRLDAALRGTPCILLTASDDRGEELRALDAGADAFVRKDEDLEVVLARLGAVLRRASNESADGSALHAPKRVLVVDDSETYLQVIASVLRSDGYDVVMARSGEEALEMLAVQTVDCILLDLVMPGLSGKDTCRQIKSTPNLRDLPLIIVTSIEDRHAMIEGLTLGADDFIAKSSDLDVIKARVRAQIRRKQFEDAHRRIREELLRSQLEATEARSARQLAEARAALVESKAKMAEELERKNKELEAFSYSVSHDLRGPLRSIHGFSHLLLEDYANVLDADGRDYLLHVRAAAQRMSDIIDDLLLLSRVSRAELRRAPTDLAEIARNVAAELQNRHPDRTVELAISEGLVADADYRLMRVVFDNLIGNAWKFTAKTPEARIELGVMETERDGDGNAVFFVRDNGAGFDMTYAQKLFQPFQRLHTEEEFSGTGIGLATVQRVVDRHGGRVWAKGEVGRGATVFFTIPRDERGGSR